MSQRSLKLSRPNKPAAGNAGIASQFTVEHHWPGVPEPERWADVSRSSALLVMLALLVGCVSHQPTSESAVSGQQSFVYIGAHGDNVRSPGVYAWYSGMTIADLITQAGGLGEFAGHASLHVLHPDRSEKTYATIRRGKGVKLSPGDKVWVVVPW